ncbi:MAG: thiolase domain-containing protein, partial [Firmicutes bacterium]|nr:thiolase domain-containing protein [Bacillota bacterium]
MERVAVLGAGMTRFMRRAQETGKELAWEAARMALDEAGMTLKDIECVALVSAPDAFDGVHMKGEYLADGAGATRKPFMRSYVGGGSGVFAIIHGWYHVASGHFDTCLVVAEEKMSSTMPHPQAAFNTIYDQFTERPLGVNLLWIFALEMNRYMQVHKIPLETIAQVSVKNKRNGLDHPCHQEGITPGPDLTVKDVLDSEIMVWPVHRLMVSPVTDGAAAL